MFVRLLFCIRDIRVRKYRRDLKDDPSGVRFESLELVEFVVGVGSG